MDGTKRVEFRRKNFSRKPSHAVIYATAPIQRVVGYFEISQIVETDPESLWRKFNKIGGVKRKDFLRYYDDRKTGIAIKIKRVHAIDRPLPLRCINKVDPPQSFVYLPSKFIKKLQVIKIL
jgi:predicted transcriptional regulator